MWIECYLNAVVDFCSLGADVFGCFSLVFIYVFFSLFFDGLGDFFLGVFDREIINFGFFVFLVCFSFFWWCWLVFRFW